VADVTKVVLEAGADVGVVEELVEEGGVYVDVVDVVEELVVEAGAEVDHVELVEGAAELLATVDDGVVLLLPLW